MQLHGRKIQLEIWRNYLDLHLLGVTDVQKNK